MVRADNPVADAVRRLGGPSRVARLLEMSNAAIHRSLAKGRMPTNSVRARERVARLSRLSRVSVLRLAGLTPPDNA